MTKVLKVGSRGSELAIRQTEEVIFNLNKNFPNYLFKIVKVQTLGDKKQGTPQAACGDKKDWIVGLEEAILSSEVDFAIHSAKDVPLDISQETSLLPVLERKAAIDILVLKTEVEQNKNQGLKILQQQATIGTASLRRQAQIQSYRRDLKTFPLRGNVTSRLRKLEESGEFEGIVIAQAGLERLGVDKVLEKRVVPIPLEQIIPAVNQGMLVAQYATERDEIAELLNSLVEHDNHLIFLAERSCIEKLGADCKSAVGVYAEIEKNVLKIRAGVFSLDGSKSILESASGESSDAIVLGKRIAEKLLSRGAAELLKA